MELLSKIDKNNIPRHIAIIMDGNGRWAKKRGAMRIFGHNNAITSVREATETCAELGVKCLTLYAFSVENWNRPKDEIEGLMKLLISTLSSEIKKLSKNNIRLKTIGNIKDLPLQCQKELESAMDYTKDNTGLELILALSYGGRWDIVNATKKIAEKVAAGDMKPEDITPELFSSNLSTHAYPDPELMIRTSGEMRISNFLLWEIAYSEIYVTEVLWPDFRKEHLLQALIDYQKRERRFGMISEQVTR